MKKILFNIVCILFLLSVNSTVILSYTPVNIPEVMNQEEGIVLFREDVIVTIRRVHNGKLQYRRWNETRGKWVDPDWIDMV